MNPFALPSSPLKRDFTSPSAFLGSLPGYTDKFAQGFTDQVAEDSWKMFINESMMLDDDDAQPAGSYSQPANAKRSEAAMLAGVVGGLEVCGLFLSGISLIAATPKTQAHIQPYQLETFHIFHVSGRCTDPVGTDAHPTSHTSRISSSITHYRLSLSRNRRNAWLDSTK